MWRIDMDLARSIESREDSIISARSSRQSGVDDSTGKGLGAEAYVEDHLLTPYLPAGFRCAKGNIVSTEARGEQSPPIDRVIYDSAAGAPLLLDSVHSVL